MFSAAIESAGKTSSPKNVPDPVPALRFLQSRSDFLFGFHQGLLDIPSSF
jgi:hypothetical protein